MLRWLVAQGVRPLLVDWGVPARHEAGMGIADYISRLEKLTRRAQHIAGGRGVHVLGHCLGGNLALGLAAAKPALVRSLILLSTPWDFHAGDRRLGKYAAASWRVAAEMLPEGELVPAQFVQSLFTLLQPMAVTEKFRQLSEAPPDEANLRRFALVEDWLNDGVPLTRPVCREIVEEWYGANRPWRGAWRVGDILLRPRNITVPALVVVPEMDHIVPAAAAAALGQQLPEATVLRLPLGHIGMIVGATARDLLWRPVAEWVRRQEPAGGKS
ncbi:MAG: alpha/beta fold hydrolase [Alphaproteobacteria bacterium]